MIDAMSLAEIAPLLQGRLVGDDCEFTAVSTDTRSLREGDLFVALTGPNFDGNQYVGQAAARGASGAIVEQAQDLPLPQLEVGNARAALGAIGHLNRSRFHGPVIAVTGSSGKTTVKEMIARILAETGVVLATDGNLNNELGVPLTLLRLEKQHTHAVIELGASALGEIAYTVRLAAPDVALITNAAGAHLEGFGSLENIVEAKGEIYDGLEGDGVGIVNLDDPAAARWMLRLGTRSKLTFSLEDAKADFSVAEIAADATGAQQLRIRTPGGELALRLGVPGRHNVANALAATAAAWAVGTEAAAICAGLESFQSVRGRLFAMTLSSGAHLIDDTYNANPASFAAAIEVLAGAEGERVLVMGDMAELGPDAAQAHRDVGALARALGIEHLLAVGTLSQGAAEEFGENGRWCSSREELLDLVQKMDRAGVTLLVKGSRSARMDQVVNALGRQEDV